MADIPKISVSDVKQRMDRGETVVFVDSRNPTAWGNSDRKLPGAVRVPSDQVDHHYAELPPNLTIVTYCT